MIGLLIEFVLESAVIVVAGTFLVRYSDVLGDRLRMGRSLAGLLLLAIATSLPELLVGCHAARLGAVDLAVGDLLGSSLFNLLILAILDLATRTRGRMLNRTVSAHALSAVTSVLLTVIVLMFILLDLDWSVGHIGAGSIAIGVAYLFSLRLVFFDQQFSRQHETEEHEELVVSMSLWKALTGYLLATGAIFLAAPRLADTSNALALETGLGGTIVGTILVALVTSLPEATTTFSALRLGMTDMAIGNILGSNTFNMVIMIGLDLSFGSPILSAVSPVHTLTAAAVILVTCVATMGMLYRVERRIWVIEPDAILVILLVLGALGMVTKLGIVH